MRKPNVECGSLCCAWIINTAKWRRRRRRQPQRQRHINSLWHALSARCEWGRFSSMEKKKCPFVLSFARSLMMIFLNSVFRWTTKESITVWLRCTVIKRWTNRILLFGLAWHGITHVTVILIACSRIGCKSDLKYTFHR